MNPKIEILSVNRSEQKGTIKIPCRQAEVDLLGLAGDAHAGPGLRQVSLLDKAAIDRFAETLDRTIEPGEFGENLTVRGLPTDGVFPLDCLRFEQVELQVTQLGKECHGAGCAIFQQVGTCVMPREGVFARVRQGGILRPDMKGSYLPRTLHLKIITLSDRAMAGVYVDRSGPLIRQRLEEYFLPRHWQLEIDLIILPDEIKPLDVALSESIAAGADVIFTTGGTGVGPRDITSEVVSAHCEKFIPGIMEHVRLHYGAVNPRAWLSRSVAGIAGRTQIYALPGSPKAVEEYLQEIFKILDHVVYILQDLDPH
ncbi:MAG: molybdenum cofactor synthesis domain-containing protein [Thermoguttaceae bacterium]|jgi:molybdenum cofactor synthesis domain-containing protein